VQTDVVVIGASLRELIALSGAGRISQRDLRIPLRLAFYHLTRSFRRPAAGAGAAVYVRPQVQLCSPLGGCIMAEDAPSARAGAQDGVVNT
jgi:hypothetical protein